VKNIIIHIFGGIMKNIILPIACKEEVEKYLDLWNSLPDYVE
jgi:hypothetical protein